MRLSLFPRRTAGGRRPRGFTLIEIMMSFAIFGLVLTAIYACWSLILRSKKIGADAAAQIQRERVAVRTIKEALASVLSFQADPQNYSFLAENGDNGSLSFAARLPEMFPRSGQLRIHGYDVRRVTFAIENGPNSERQLVLRQTPLLLEMHPDEKDYPFVVARNVNKMELEFWDLKKSDWVDEWTRTNELPKMIKIKLEFLRQSSSQKSTQPVTSEIVDIAPLPAIMIPSVYQGPNQPGQGQGQPPPSGGNPGGFIPRQ
jgi:general secretion pathway protein J